jgi:hypothetical protein
VETPDKRKKKFTSALRILKKLSDAGNLFISLKPPFTVDFEIPRDVLTQELKSSRLTEKEFLRFSDEISAMLDATLCDEANRYIEARIQRSLDTRELKKPEIAARRALLTEEIEMVRAELFSKHLEGRYDLKKSSKAPTFTDVDWDVKVKTQDFKLGKLNFPYATFRITFQRNFRDDPLTLFAAPTFDSMQINFTLDEIDYLVQALEKARGYLRQLEKEGKC